MEDYSFYSPPLSTKPVANSKATSEEEESGWTAYFQDFSDHHQEQQHEEQSLCSSFAATSSMVSDAASHAAWRFSRGGHNHVGAAGDLGSPKTPIKLSFKKTRSKQISAHDDSLEDTASSPVNSPKVHIN